MPLVLRAPWCIPCVIASTATAEPQVLAALHQLPGSPAFLTDPGSDELLPARVAASIRARMPPRASQLAEYLVRRLRRLELRETLERLLASATEDVPTRPVPDRTLRDRVRRFGPLTPRCWRNVGVLCRVAASCTGDGAEALAWHAGVGPRTLRAWTRRYLAVSPGEFQALLGWEWVIEAALRVGGYVGESPVTSRHTRRPVPPEPPRLPPSLLAAPAWRLTHDLRDRS